MASVAIEPKQKPQRRGIDWLIDRYVRNRELRPVIRVRPGNGTSKVPFNAGADRNL